MTHYTKAELLQRYTQILDAARRLGLTVAEATHGGKPYLYAPKPGTGKIQ